MSNMIRIKLAKVNDLPSIKPLLVELMAAIDNTEGFDIEKSIENCAILLKDPANYMLVAKEKGRLVGFVNFTTRRTIMHPSPSGLIDELVVTKDSLGKGIGKQLILAVVDMCRELGCCEVEVSTEKSNIKAREFYISCGFEGDAVLFEKDIRESVGVEWVKRSETRHKIIS